MPKVISIPVKASTTDQVVTVTIPDPVPALTSTKVDSQTIQTKGTVTQADPTYTVSGGTTPPPDPDGQTVLFKPLTIDYARRNAGANNFYGGNGMQSPLSFNYLANDTRYKWRDVQPSQTGYNFGPIAADINTMVRQGGKLSFRVVTCDIGTLAFPGFIPQLATNQPDFNSELYISSYEKFVAALATYLNNTDSAIPGIKLITGVYKVDIGGIGNWSEMHWFQLTVPVITAANGQRIINAFTSSFPNTWLGITISGLTNNSKLGAMLATALLNARNNKGPVYIRCDHLGKIETYNFDMDASKYWTSDMLPAVKARHLTSPMCGELMNELSTINPSSPYSDLQREITGLGLSEFSNNNWCRNTQSGASQSQIAASDKNIAAASMFAGARVTLLSAVIHGSSLTLNFSPFIIYDDWQVIAVTDKGNSQPANLRGATSLTLSIPDNATKISVIIKDNDGFGQPYPLNIEGRQVDGSYVIV